MPRYKVIQYRDAVVRYEAEIDADGPEAALSVAKAQDCAWTGCGVSAYDSADMEVRDMDGRELIASHQVW